MNQYIVKAGMDNKALIDYGLDFFLWIENFNGGIPEEFRKAGVGEDMIRHLMRKYEGYRFNGLTWYQSLDGEYRQILVNWHDRECPETCIF